MSGEGPAHGIAHFPRQRLLFRGEDVPAVRGEDYRRRRLSDWLAE